MARVEAIRDLIREGNTPAARTLIRKAADLKLSRRERLQIAFLANGLELSETTIRLLHRRVRGSGRSPGDATDEEKAEYALALGRSGSLREAVALITDLDWRRFPRFGIFLAFLHFRLHDYDRMVNVLRAVLRAPKLTEAERLNSKIRLATALAHGPTGDFAEANRLLDEVIKATSAESFRQIRWFAFLIRAQCRMLEARYAEARAALAELIALYPDEAGEGIEFRGYAEYASYWGALVDLHENPVTPESRARLLAAAAKFREAGLWEHPRMADFYLALRTGDRALARHLVFGTPIEKLRAEVLEKMGDGTVDLATPYELVITSSPRARTAREWLDVLTGENSASDATLKTGQALQRMLHALLADFYVLPDVHMLHQRVFPDDHYNPSSSPVRTRQIIKRLRRWLANAGVRLTVDEEAGRYSLSSDAGIRLVISREAALQAAQSREEPPRLAQQLRQLATTFGDRQFSAAQAEATLGLSRSSAVTVLRQGCGLGKLVRHGSGAATLYSSPLASDPHAGRK